MCQGHEGVADGPLVQHRRLARRLPRAADGAAQKPPPSTQQQLARMWREGRRHAAGAVPVRLERCRRQDAVDLLASFRASLLTGSLIQHYVCRDSFARDRMQPC